jgi:protein-tyrosine phosphatase
VVPERLRRRGITHIINCTMEVPCLKMPDIECTQIKVGDLPGARLCVHFDRAADIIHRVRQKGGRILVHCMAGVSRSATLCIVYLMKYQRMSLRESYNYVKSKRPIIRPNPGFFRQMIDYEKSLFGRNTVSMIQSQAGPIPDVYGDMMHNMVMFTPSRRR